MNLLLLLGIGTFFVPQIQNTLTIAEAVEIGLKNAFAIRIADSNIEKSRQKATEARGALGPKLNLDSTYTRNDQASKAIINGNPVTISPLDSGNARLSVSYPLDIVGVNKLAIEAARASIASAQKSRDAESNIVRGNVRKAYFQLLQAVAQVQVQQDALASIRETLRITRVKFDAGAVPQFDVIRFEADEQDAQSALIAASNRVLSSKQLLNNAMGRAIETDFEPVPINTLPSTAFNRPQLAQDLLTVAAENRNELFAIRHRLTALAKVTRSEERGNLPSLTVGATHTRNFKVGGFGGREFSTVGNINFSFPIFDSGITRARVKAARQDEEQARIQFDQQMLLISLEVRQALVNLNNAHEQLAVTKKAVEKSAEAFRIARVRYDAGGGISLEVTNAQTEMTRAKTAELNARFSYLASFADLQRAIGTDQVEPKPEKGEAQKL